MNIRLSLVKLLSVLTLILLLMGSSQEEQSNGVPAISLPTPKIEHFSDHLFNISKYSSIINSDYIARYKSALSSLKSTIATYGSNKKSKPGGVVFQLVKDSLSAMQEFKQYIDQPESYAIQFSKKKILIQAKSETGLLNGLTTLEYFIIKNQGKLKPGLLIDYPDIKNRVLHLPLWPENFEAYKNIIRQARFNHYNALILLIMFKGVNMQSANHLATVGTLSKQELKEIVNYAKENGLEVIPELRLLSHQEYFFGDSHPELMFNKYTYNPLNKNVYKYVFAAIDEVVELTGASKFHIGHDEVVGKGKSKLPADLFLKDVIILNNYLNSKNIETWMWGDMLISTEQYPMLKKAGGVHGNKSYTDLLYKLPKNITICDWHYRGQEKNFLSTYDFAKAGFKVYGATWQNKEIIRNFSTYVTTMPENVEGMIATTWYRTDKKREEVLGIINYSGEIFWNAKNYKYTH